MTTLKALHGKLYAGNPHVRFDEGEVAPAATPRRGSLLYTNVKSYVVNPHARFRPQSILAIMAGVVFALTASADVAWSLNGGTLNVVASSTDAGKGLKLLWDESDRGTNPEDWSNGATIVSCVPANGGRYAVDLGELGISNGTTCRIATFVTYNRLDKLGMFNTGCYVITGIVDSDCYSARFGFYGDSQTSSYYNAYGAIIGNDYNQSGFLVTVGNQAIGNWMIVYRGVTDPAVIGGRPAVSNSEINEAEFVDGKFTLNGTTKTGLESGALGESGAHVVLGRGIFRTGGGTGTPYQTYHHGWWSHVSFDDAEGNKMLDYIPVQRASDGKVGFWDRVTSRFVTSSGNGDFTAGTQTGEAIETALEMTQVVIVPNRELGVSANQGILTISVPSGLVGERLMVLWDAEDRGDEVLAWSHSAVIVESAEARSYSVRMSSLGIRNGDVCRVAAANAFQLLDKLQMADANCYVNTGVVDSNCYGVRFGFYGTSQSSPNGFGAVIGRDSPSEDGFLVTASSDSIANWIVFYRSTKDAVGTRPAVSNSEINEAEFAGGVFTLNATTVKTGLASGPVGETGAQVVLGRWTRQWSNGSTYYRCHPGWWSHVSFDDADGNRILDYIPAKRVSDGKVGFYDRAKLAFVTSSGTGNFSAGAVTNETPIVAVNASKTFTIKGIPGFMIIIH